MKMRQSTSYFSCIDLEKLVSLNHTPSIKRKAIPELVVLQICLPSSNGRITLPHLQNREPCTTFLQSIKYEKKFSMV